MKKMKRPKKAPSTKLEMWNALLHVDKPPAMLTPGVSIHEVDISVYIPQPAEHRTWEE